MHQRKNQVNLDPDIQPSNFRPPHKIQVNYDPFTEITSTSIPDIEIKPISTTHTKTRSTSMLTLKPSAFRPACKNQVNFDHTQKPGQSISKLQKKSFSARTRKAVIAILALKPSQFRCIHGYQLIVGPNTTIKSTSTLRTKKSMSIPTLKRS